MKRHLLLNPQNSETEGGGTAVVEATADSQTTPTTQVNKSEETPSPNKKGVPVSRKPTDEELKTTFTTADVPGLDFQVEQLPAQKSKEAEKPVVKLEEVKKEVAEVAKQVEKPKAVFDEPLDPAKLANKVKEYDYTGHSDEEVKVLKNMSVQSREVVSKLMKEKKQLETLKDASYLQHPNAYQLNPEFQKINEDEYFVKAEYQHWEEQLSKIKAGELWQPITGWNPKTGEPILSDPRKPTDKDEENVRLRMQQCVGVYNQTQQQKQQFVGTYNQRLQQDQQLINAERARRFTWASDPKMLDQKVFVNETVGEVPIRKVKDDFKAMFPTYHQSSPVMEIASDLMVGILLYGQQLREALAGKEVAETKKEEILRAEPTSKSQHKDARKAVGGVKEFSLEGMP